ncbi:BrnA antitoxin family protein [Cupriavidus gilardii]|uniref:BrnA antitoxin family protein n=1 Tax=Cupriavidus gilardii TaxID=82541 RepID=UPI0021BF4406|nr:BrnA antitoxin family protein [Cupriavidus gilardii]MCT9117047.1 BrnA antitoxin family protein [Cupriavidus gilardii]
MSTKRKIHIPTDAEDEALTRAALSDPDNPPLTDDEMASMRPAKEVLPSLVGEKAAQALLKRRGRPPLPADERKVTLNMRADRDVIEAFRATGEGWQSRINDVLRAYARSHRMLPRG